MSVFFWRQRRQHIKEADLSAYVDGRPEQTARVRIEAHVESCAECREALVELRALRTALRELPRVAAPRSFALREADVRPVAAGHPAGTTARAPALLGGLASVALVAFVMLVSVDVLDQPSEERAASSAPLASQEFGDVTEGQSATPGLATPDMQTLREGDAVAEGDDGAAEADAGPRQELPGALYTEDTQDCPPNADCPAEQDEVSEPSRGGKVGQGGDRRVPLRAGEAAAAAVAIMAAGSLALVYWRRRVSA